MKKQNKSNATVKIKDDASRTIRTVNKNFIQTVRLLKQNGKLLEKVIHRSLEIV